jgi:multidrug resistance efflux pump
MLGDMTQTFSKLAGRFAPSLPKSGLPLTRRLSGAVLGLGIVAVGFVPFQRLLQRSSFEAVVVAPTITLRAPIDGEVEAGPVPLDPGALPASGDILLHIRNHRADRSRVDDLTRQIEQLKDERPGLAARLDAARAQLGDLTQQTRLFAEARILQLEARQDELKAEVAAAQARNEEAKTTLDRFTALAGRGWTPVAQLNQAQRDGSVAQMLEAAARKRLEAVGVELAAAQRGVFIGGGSGSNDRPRYMQRADQVEQQVSSLTETLAERDKRERRLTGDLAEEKARHGLLAEADVAAPVTGRVSEVLIAPGEQVRRGQDMLHLLDCGRVVVTAVISGSVYDRLRVGSPVRFEPRDSREEHPGRVVSLTATSSARANLAGQASPLAPASYRVTISIPDLANEQNCTLGRTGRVFFGDGAPEATATATPEPGGTAALTFRSARWWTNRSALQ